MQQITIEGKKEKSTNKAKQNVIKTDGQGGGGGGGKE